MLQSGLGEYSLPYRAGSFDCRYTERSCDKREHRRTNEAGANGWSVLVQTLQQQPAWTMSG